jgi:hypothetical protein
MRSSVRISLVLALSTAFADSNIFAQGGTAAARDRDAEIQAALRRHEPGPSHKAAASAFSGTWAARWTVWTAPGQPPSDRATGTATFRMVMGGRFVEGAYRGNGILGKAFEGTLLIGYDAERERFVATWINTFETGVATYEGAGDIDARSGRLMSLQLRGRPSPHPTSPDTTGVRSVFRFDASGTITEETFVVGANGSEYKAVEVIYTRRAARGN